MDRSKNIDRLLKVKELRRRLAEIEASQARNALYAAEDALARAKENEFSVRANSDVKRNERLNHLLEGGGNIAVQSIQLKNAYALTEQEINQAIEHTKHQDSALGEAAECASLAQQKLARFLQIEERTRKLCEKLAEMKHKEAIRHN